MFGRIQKRAGLKGIRLHDRRHLHATQLLAAGVPVPTVSGRLGHANAATTLNVYAHFLEARNVTRRMSSATCWAPLNSCRSTDAQDPSTMNAMSDTARHNETGEGLIAAPLDEAIRLAKPWN